MPLGAVSATTCGALGIMGLILMMASAYVVVEMRMLSQGRVLVAAACALFAGAVVLCWVFTACCRYGMQFVEPDMVAFVPLLGLPFGVLVALLTLDALLVALLAVRLQRLRRHRITPDSVKEALDMLPDGVCFSRSSGVPLLVNVQMDALAHDVFGTAVHDEGRLWERLSTGESLTGVAVAYEQGDAQLLLTTPAGRSWELRRQTLATEAGSVVETLATDVSEELALAAELEHRNEQLAQVGERLRAYGDDLVRLTREEEVLAAKVRVHDEVGRALVALRAYERQDPARRDREALLGIWRRMAGLLQAVSEGDEGPDAWQLLSKAARAVDIQLVVDGELPEQPDLRELVVMLVHECVNNAVRHADAHRVEVVVNQGQDGLTVCVTNDGRPPTGPIDETGGLANLRTAVERAHGTMLVEWEPRFAVVLRVMPEEN